MFNNAGTAPENPSLSISDVEYNSYKKVFDVNVYGSFLGAKHAASAMIPVRKGSIIFTSSVASVTHGNLPHLYVASKHALVGLTKNLCVELGQHGIRVNCISPYGVATPMMTEGMGGIDKKMVEDIMGASANPKQAVLEANDVAEAALYLGSDESKYVVKFGCGWWI
ncbi:short chain alcohol dehydrogenase, putative [Ricinus communis]|uniref:Short chain alcohol dehydrogenase, putative n=1 Tax=Ricinus communis TaxID=3988 RepID=B9SW05_RICCO|nr:short chain alcohol dehydrogenase, putative [Ricinus communis]